MPVWSATGGIVIGILALVVACLALPEAKSRRRVGGGGGIIAVICFIALYCLLFRPQAKIELRTGAVGGVNAEIVTTNTLFLQGRDGTPGGTTPIGNTAEDFLGKSTHLCRESQPQGQVVEGMDECPEGSQSIGWTMAKEPTNGTLLYTVEGSAHYGEVTRNPTHQNCGKCPNVQNGCCLRSIGWILPLRPEQEER